MNYKIDRLCKQNKMRKDNGAIAPFFVTSYLCTADVIHNSTSAKGTCIALIRAGVNCTGTSVLLNKRPLNSSYMSQGEAVLLVLAHTTDWAAGLSCTGSEQSASTNAITQTLHPKFGSLSKSIKLLSRWLFIISACRKTITRPALECPVLEWTALCTRLVVVNLSIDVDEDVSNAVEVGGEVC